MHHVGRPPPAGVRLPPGQDGTADTIMVRLVRTLRLISQAGTEGLPLSSLICENYRTAEL